MPKQRTLTLWCIILIELYSQHVGSLYRVTRFEYKIYIPQPCTQRVHRNSPTDIYFSNFWQNISNTNIYFVIFIFVFRFEEYMSVVFIYVLVLDISCQQLGEMCQLEGFCAPRNLVTFGNIYICMGYMLTTFGEYTSVGGFLCALRTQS